MPRGNKTGPQGQGPMTGRAAGFCAGYDTPGFANPNPGRGQGVRGGAGNRLGRGQGGYGRGRRNRFFATGQPGWMRDDVSEQDAPTTQRQSLESQIEVLRSQLSHVQDRLSELDDSKTES